MKRAGDIINRITLDLLRAEAHAALARRRRKIAAAVYFVDHFDDLGEDLLQALQDGTWEPAPLHTVTIFEHGKERKLEIPSFRDVVAQRAILEAGLGKACLNHTHAHSFSSVRGRGPLKCAKHVARVIRHRSGKWCLYFDVRKYYQHIIPEIVKADIRRVVKDRRALILLDRIIGQGEEGLPIGNTLSHLFANLYLTPILEAIEKLPGVTDLVAYMDNVLIFGPSKKKLHAVRARAVELLAARGLEMKGDWQIFNAALRPVDVCGYHIRAGKPWRLRRPLVAHLKQALRRYRRASKARHPGRRRRAARSAISLRGWLICSGSRSLLSKLCPASLFNQLRKATAL